MPGLRTVLAAVLLGAIAGATAPAASAQWLTDTFSYPSATSIPNWTVEFGGDWRANGASAVSDIQFGWQYLLRDGVRDRDCVIESVVRYDAPSEHLQFMGPMARTTIQAGVLSCYMAKTQDNKEKGSGQFTAAYLYYYESPLVFKRLATHFFPKDERSTRVRTRLLVMDDGNQVRVMGFWDTNLDGVWEVTLTAFRNERVGETSETGLAGFSQCFADDWKYYNACLYAKNAKPGTGSTLELVARGQAGAAYQAGSSLSRTGIPLPRGRSIPLASDLLLLASLNLPSVFRDFSGVLDANGDATLEVDIPDESALKGVVFYTAFVTLASNGRLLEISNDAQAEIKG